MNENPARRIFVRASLLLALAFLFWVPFGFRGGVTGDAWILFMQAEQGSAFSDTAATRLLLPTAWVIGYALTPGSFIGFNLLLLALLFGKSWLIYLILRRFVEPLAFAAALLYLFLPVDRGIFYLGALGLHFNVFCCLLAIHFLLEYWRRRQLLAWFVVVFAQLFAVAASENAYPLLALAPVLLLLLEKRLSRRWLEVTLMWFVIPAFYAAWIIGIILLFPRAGQYQASLAGVDRSFGAIAEAFVAMTARHFYDFDLQLPENALYAALAVTAAVIAFFLLRSVPLKPPPHPWRWALAGLLILSLGIALYLPTTLRHDPVRTAFFSGIGAALTLAVLLWMIGGARFFPWLVAGCVGVFTLPLLAQHDATMRFSERQQEALLALVESVPALSADTVLVLFDPERELVRVFDSPIYPEYMVPVAYGDHSLRAILCFSLTADETCEFAEEAFSAPSLRTFAVQSPYERLVVVEYREGAFAVFDGDWQGYQPRSRIGERGTGRAAELFR
ncbi:MAG: hypothetical protein JNL42_13465 [Anaerolineae bacterium]|nr:hypothetical protein [Anaerolineae bacterium]